MQDECYACGLPDADCICSDDDGNERPECHDCGQELDPNGFCDYAFCPSADEDF